MRKNGVNRELTPIDGGICAPCGFYASDVYCANVGEEKPSFAVVLAEKRCETAYLPSLSTNVSAFVSLSQIHTQKCLSSAVLVYNVAASTQGEKEDDLAEKISRFYAPALKIDRNELLLVSTGEYGKKLELSTFENVAKTILKNKGIKEQNSLAVAKVLDENNANQLAFSFELGDIVCKIGAVFCGGIDETKPLVCMLTTDVDICSKLLQKALKAAFMDGFNMLGGRIDTPNDCVFALASKRAGNWRISENNSDYQKFAYALNEVVKRICERMAKAKGKVLSCKVLGAKSKVSAREISKAVVSSSIVKDSLEKRNMDTQAVIALTLSCNEKVAMDKLSISYSAGDLEIVAFEDNREIAIAENITETLFGNEKLEIIINLNEGNYSASAIGSFA